MIRKTVTTGISPGPEARPVAMLVQIASQYESRIYLESNTARVNAKSIMGMMTLQLKDGQPVTVSADGADEEKALGEIEAYLMGTK